MRRKPIFPIAIAFILQAAVVALDLYFRDLDTTISWWRLSREGIFGISILLLFIGANLLHHSAGEDLRSNLLSIIRNIILLFLTGFVVGMFLAPAPEFNPDRLTSLTRGAIFYNGIITFIAIYAFSEIFVLLKPFVYYRRDRLTQLQYYLFAIFVLVTATINTLSDLDSPVNLAFSGDTLLADIALAVTMLLGLWLATRNRWIPFLSRREKFFYFVGSLFFFVALSFLGQWLDEIPKHTQFGAGFTNALWLFLFAYSGLAAIYLFVHLPTARMLDRKLRELKSLQDLSSSISQELDFDRLVIQITKSIADVLEAHASWLVLYHEEDNNYYIASYQNLTHEQIAAINTGADNGLSETLLRSREVALVEAVAQNEAYRHMKKIFPGIESLIAAPLMTSDERGLGVLFASKNTRYGFNPDDLVLLTAFASQAIIALENSRRISENLERQRLLQEMTIAMEVQQRLLPQATPRTSCYDIAAINQPANEVGGDYYDFIAAHKQHLILIGDVSGKGTSAAFYMAELKGAIQANRDLAHSPAELLIQTNNTIYDSLDRATFITMSAMLLDEEKNQLRFSRAGHNSLLKLGCNGEMEEINPPGIGLGLARGNLFDHNMSQYEADISPGDIYILYTDGISEAMNHQREEFGDDRFKEIIRRSAQLPAADIIGEVIAEINRFADGTPPHDDMTLIVIKVNKPMGQPISPN
jgi:sigma-B regulation protein RsbU (phosphoserine phosphatase)